MNFASFRPWCRACFNFLICTIYFSFSLKLQTGYSWLLIFIYSEEKRRFIFSHPQLLPASSMYYALLFSLYFSIKSLVYLIRNFIDITHQYKLLLCKYVSHDKSLFLLQFFMSLLLAIGYEVLRNKLLLPFLFYH